MAGIPRRYYIETDSERTGATLIRVKTSANRFRILIMPEMCGLKNFWSRDLLAES